MKCPLCSAGARIRFVETRDARQYWLCENCALVWLEEAQRPSRAAEEARYRTHENFGTEYLTYLGRTALPLAELLRPGAKGLDYGCGPTKGMEKVLSPLGFSVDSYDPIFFPKISLPENHYDFLLCSEAAEHFFHPGTEFARMSSLVKNGGFFAISSWLAVEKEQFDGWAYRRDPTHVVFYQEETIGWIAENFGWEILKLENPVWILKKSRKLNL